MSDEDSPLFISSSKEPRRYGGMHIAIWNEKITRVMVRLLKPVA